MYFIIYTSLLLQLLTNHQKKIHKINLPTFGKCVILRNREAIPRTMNLLVHHIIAVVETK